MNFQQRLNQHVRSAREDQPVKMRVEALGALRNMTFATDNEVHMWNDVQGCRAVVLRSAREDQPEELRVLALKALYNMACAADNQGPMWNDVQGCRAIVLRSAREDQPEEVRVLALFAQRYRNHFSKAHTRLVGVMAPSTDLTDDQMMPHAPAEPDVAEGMGGGGAKGSKRQRLA